MSFSVRASLPHSVFCMADFRSVGAVLDTLTGNLETGIDLALLQ
jgi:hypothetical protein